MKYYYSAIKISELLIHTTIRINLKIIRLNGQKAGEKRVLYDSTYIEFYKLTNLWC